MNDLTQQQLNEIKVCVTYYMQMHISINNPRYQEYEAILEKLNKTLQSI